MLFYLRLAARPARHSPNGLPALRERVKGRRPISHGVGLFYFRGTILSMIVEIHAAEGGDDAKLLVADQANIYARLCERRCL